MVLLQHILALPFLCLGYSSIAASAPANSNGDPSSSYPWQWGGAHQDVGYWFDEFQDTLATMQSPTFWNGTYWPASIQWIGAVLNTLVVASDRSLAHALQEYGGGDVPGAYTTAASIQIETQKYFSDVEAYYGDEDVIQIFDAAYDDAQWVVLEWLEAIEFINQYDAYANSALGQADIARFAHRAHIFYNIVQSQFDTSLCGGGITWNPALAPYKNAITNELFISSSIGMYLYFPGDTDTDPYPSPAYVNATNTTLPALPALAAHNPSLLTTAVEEYAWFKTHNFTDAQGLIVDGFHISDNQTTCDQRNEMVYTYNQGVLLSGLRQLWEATGDAMYLTDGYAFVQTVINATGWYARSAAEAGQWTGLGRNGIMEDYCDAPANCSQDNQIFKGIYFHHLDLFCDPLPTSTPLVAGLTKVAPAALASEHASKCASYTPWIKHNANAALSTRNSTGVIGGWWGASYVNKTQEPWPAYAAPRPRGSSDEWNEPWVLEQEPWLCRGWHCREGGRAKRGNRKRTAGLFSMRGAAAKRDANDGGRGRTVETEGSGLGVVKAASDFTLRSAS
ncbi:hypothetical protein LTR08_003289 [Meristemomyces frigidus]|nr:hypothetical protein LTR08_003289 [Meristemomyces frigidus]